MMDILSLCVHCTMAHERVIVVVLLLACIAWSNDGYSICDFLLIIAG